VKESRYNIWVERDDGAYVYNGMSGSLLRVSHDDHAALRRFVDGAGDHGLSADAATNLAIGRMLVADDGDELAVLRSRYERSRHDESSFGLTIVTSLGCNFDCPYCFEAKHPSILSPAVEASVVAVLDDQLERIDDFHVTWFGGEPLVGKRPLLSLSDTFIARCDAASVGYTAGIVTNGYLLSESTCRELAERRVTSAQVGLDGPPDVHNRMRPLATGGDSFWRIVENLHHAVEHMEVTVRVNVDASNVDDVEPLLQILADEGLGGGKLGVYAGHIVGVAENEDAPSTSYEAGHTCFTTPEFAEASLAFARMTERYGFGFPALPQSSGTPCTAVRANELIVGSDGELYKCWDSVGSEFEVIGHIDDYRNTNGRMRRWLAYDPFSNDECASCVALPVCMGGCAHHAMDINLYEDRCGTFRFNYQDRVAGYVESHVGMTERTAPTVAVDPPTRRVTSA
jgi:uncharacterized protein